MMSDTHQVLLHDGLPQTDGSGWLRDTVALQPRQTDVSRSAKIRLTGGDGSLSSLSLVSMTFKQQLQTSRWNHIVKPAGCDSKTKG